MAESIFNRISRILTASVEDSVDRLEQAGGEAVMREAIREADRAVDRVAAEREAALARRLQAARQQALLAKRIEALTEKARFALESGREDLAEAALSQQFDFEAQAVTLAEAQVEAQAEEARIEEGLAALKARKAQMEDTLSAYRQARTEAAGGSSSAERSAERQVDAAEQAFARAMTGAGAPVRADAASLRGVAEIDVLQRRAAIAERLAALKAARAA
ncbi:PspA/IM30 family protein [Methylobacterium sp. Gmos1]